jgi:hypothetical protein
VRIATQAGRWRRRVAHALRRISRADGKIRTATPRPRLDLRQVLDCLAAPQLRFVH